MIVGVCFYDGDDFDVGELMEVVYVVGDGIEVDGCFVEWDGYRGFFLVMMNVVVRLVLWVRVRCSVWILCFLMIVVVDLDSMKCG